jgi:hypothetical protein
MVLKKLALDGNAGHTRKCDGENEGSVSGSTAVSSTKNFAESTMSVSKNGPFGSYSVIVALARVPAAVLR